MKWLSLLSLIALSMDASSIELNKYLLTPKTKSHLKMIVKRMEKKKMETVLRDFVKCCRPSRMVGTSGHKDAVPYLIDQIKKIDSKGTGLLIVDPFKPDVLHGMELYQADFNKKIVGKYAPSSAQYKKWKGFTDSMLKTLSLVSGVEGKNIIWEKKGYISPNDVLTISAHFDTIGHNRKTKEVNPGMEQPGADDNGSSVAIALGLIEVLSSLELPKTVRVVFFDFEELGFLGSRSYINKYRGLMKKQNFAGLINLEMLGYDTKRNDKEKRFGNFKAYIRKTDQTGHLQDKSFYQLLNKAGSQFTNGVSFKLEPNGFDLSDHIHFWGEGHAAITFSQNWESDLNPGYHTSNDFPETLNMKTWFSSFEFLSGAVLSWAFDIL